MSTLFEKVSKKLAKEIDRDLKIVNFSDATKISQFAILQKKKSTSLFREKPDEPVQVSLIDILEPNSSVSSIVNQEQEREGQKNKGAQIEVVQHSGIPSMHTHQAHLT